MHVTTQPAVLLCLNEPLQGAWQWRQDCMGRALPAAAKHMEHAVLRGRAFRCCQLLSTHQHQPLREVALLPVMSPSLVDSLTVPLDTGLQTASLMVVAKVQVPSWLGVAATLTLAAHDCWTPAAGTQQGGGGPG